MDEKRLDIIGNGLSSLLYYPREDSFRVGCNYSNPQFDPHVLFITDAKMILSLASNTNTASLATKNCIISKRVKRQLKSGLIPEDTIIVQDVFDPPAKLTNHISQIPMNSAQCAFLYYLKTNEFASIHLFGFDFFWSNHNFSLTHQYIENKNPNADKSNLVNVWKQYWKILFKMLNDNQTVHIYFSHDVSYDDFQQSFITTYGKKPNILIKRA